MANQTVVLPNGTLANNTMTNVTSQEYRRMKISVSIAYTADIRLAKEVLQKVLREDELVVQEKDRLVFVDELADSSVNLGVVCWFRQGDFWKGKWQVTENCKLALDEAGIEIPYPQLDVHMRQ